MNRKLSEIVKGINKRIQFSQDKQKGSESPKWVSMGQNFKAESKNSKLPKTQNLPKLSQVWPISSKNI